MFNNTIRLFWWNEIKMMNKKHENFGDLLGKYLVEKISKLKNDETISIKIYEANKYIDISSAYNFCDGFIKILELGLTNDFIFSSGKLVSIRSIVEEAVAAIDKRLITRINFVDEVNLAKPIYGDVSLTKKMLEWKPDESIRDTLIDMLG